MGMIKSEREYTATKQKLEAIQQEMNKIKTFYKDQPKLAQAGVLGIEAFGLQLQDEVTEYEAIKRGKIPAYFFEVDNLGLLLIALRIKSGLTQMDLADKLGVSQAQVSRDENNDYYGVGMVKVKQILKALNVDLQVKIKK